MFITIDKKQYPCQEGESVLNVALRNGIHIPHFCYHEDLALDANCRACIVEVNGNVMTSCTAKVEEGMKVKTTTAEVKRLCQINLELLLSGHKENCPKCQKGYFCRVGKAIKKFKLNTKKYSRPKINRPVHKMAQAAEFDPNLCIACNKCVEICENIGVGFLKLAGKAAQNAVDYNKDRRVDCVYCGQCTVHCPVNASREQSHIEFVEKSLKDKDKIVIAQIAPSIRCSIGEEFGLEPGANLTGQIYTALRKLGFNKIFDVNMGADITTYVEAKELAERLKPVVGGQTFARLPMFTSCCPGWVKFVEFYHPELIPNLTTARSPQIHSGGAYKTWWAAKEKLNPKKVVVVSIMPCTSKKYEARHKKLGIDGMHPVDYVLTTRELAIICKKRKIDLPNLKPSEVDCEGAFSGAAAIYGATGGVMESALRSTHFFLTGKEMSKIDFKEVRGFERIRRAEVSLGFKTQLKVAIAATVGAAEKIIQELKKNPSVYDYVEVMACPGGCIGGGGQPIPSTEKIITQRIAGLYKIDSQMSLRRAHQNPVVKEFMKYIEKLPEKKQKEILHTSYSKKKKFE